MLDNYYPHEHQAKDISDRTRTLARILSSDKDAFACLFEKYADAMYAYGRKMTPDAELVKDAIQDVFIKLYNNRQNLNETVSVKGYLLSP